VAQGFSPATRLQPCDCRLFPFVFDLLSKEIEMRRSITALVIMLAAAPLAADDGKLSIPAVPANIEAPAGTKPFFLGYAIGTQNYMCAPTTTGVAWTFVGPQATLFDERGRQLTTHFLSPNPDEAGLARATWQHSRDTSAVWARAIQSSSDPNYVAPGAVPWLLLEVVGNDEGPTGGDRLTPATHIQRLSTVGGVAPAAGCAAATDVNKRVFVPYEALYVFYKARRDH
jgi:hypothetical protein